MKSLLIVDLQNDFMPGGPLAVPQADQLAHKINPLLTKFPLVIACQDWHPKNHSSFETLWPPHCIQETEGAQLVTALQKEKIVHIEKKGSDVKIDSYSAFFDNDGMSATNLHPYLQAKGVRTLYICGVATEYCVKFTVLDALKLGYTVYLLQDLVRAVDPAKSEDIFSELKLSGTHLILSTAL